MTAATLDQRTTMISPRQVMERFVDAIAAQNLDAIAALYAPDARWEIHVPGWDTTAAHAEEIRDLHFGYFVEHRDAFAVDGYQLIEHAGSVALRWDLSWIDRRDGAACVSYQSHFFEVSDGLIHRHAMYCAGVRADERR